MKICTACWYMTPIIDSFQSKRNVECSALDSGSVGVAMAPGCAAPHRRVFDRLQNATTRSTDSSSTNDAGPLALQAHRRPPQIRAPRGDVSKLAWRSYPPLLLLRIGGNICLHKTYALQMTTDATAMTAQGRSSVPTNPKSATNQFRERHKVVETIRQTIIRLDDIISLTWGAL